MVYYYDSGEKKATCIVFVHAAFADHTSFSNQIKYFSKSFRVIALDLVGHGKSKSGLDKDRLINSADHIRAILKRESIDKVHLVGISVGGLIIQDFANKYKDAVLSLCCIGAYDINNYDYKLQKENSKAQVVLFLKGLISIKWFANSCKKISAETPDAQKAFYNMCLNFPKKSFFQLMDLSKMMNKYRISQRDYPLMIACGSKDHKIAIESAEVWHRIEPLSHLYFFENAGHLVNMDAPNQFNERLLAFLMGATN